jgi:hypothetical protein
MKRLVTIAMILGVFAFSGCDNEDAREYAKELVGVLKTYQVEVNKKIAAEKKSYKDLATTYAYAKQVDLISSLRTERFRRAENLTDALLGEEELTPAEMHALVADYAKQDFEATREMLEDESDRQAEYLGSLEALELQSQNLTVLRKALEAMAKRKGQIKQLKELAGSAKQFKAKFDELQCEELAQEIACLKAQLKAISERKDLTPEQIGAATEKIQKQIDALRELSDDQKCDQTKREDAKCPNEKG